MKIAILLFIVLVIFLSCEKEQIVTIGSQVWTSENLDVSTFRNGEAIPEAKTANEWLVAGDNKVPVWCHYDNYPKNGNKYGKLYNYYAVNDVRGLAPTGFHIPTDKDWKVLSDFLGSGFFAGEKLKSTSGWLENGNCSNSSGFFGLPGGDLYYDGYNVSFNGIGYEGSWWSCDAKAGAWPRKMISSKPNLYRDRPSKYDGLSVRCIRD